MYVKTTFLFTLIASLFWLKMANTAPINWAASNLCLKAAEPVEKRLNAPSGLLKAISLKETGRWFQKQGISYPWPWTVTANGKGIYLATKAEAIRKVEELQGELKLHFRDSATPRLVSLLAKEIGAWCEFERVFVVTESWPHSRSP